VPYEEESEADFRERGEVGGKMRKTGLLIQLEKYNLSLFFPTVTFFLHPFRF
jgi:hypothetical protein